MLNAAGVSEHRKTPGVVEQHELRVGNPLGQLLRLRRGRDAVFIAADDQCRNGDSLQFVACVGPVSDTIARFATNAGVWMTSRLANSTSCRDAGRTSAR